MKIIDWLIGLFSPKKKATITVTVLRNEPAALDDESMMRVIKKTEDEIVKAAFEIYSNDPQKIVDHLISKSKVDMSDDARQNLMVYATLTMGRARELFVG